MTDNPWTPDKVEHLKLMAARGDSGGEMAAALCMTRNAVLGKCARLGIRLGVSRLDRVGKVTVARAKPVRSVVREATAPRPVATRPPRTDLPAGAPPTPTVKGWPKPITPTAVRFIDAKERHCRMILDDRAPIENLMICGARTIIGKSWCPACHAGLTERVAERVL